MIPTRGGKWRKNDQLKANVTSYRECRIAMMFSRSCSLTKTPFPLLNNRRENVRFHRSDASYYHLREQGGKNSRMLPRGRADVPDPPSNQVATNQDLSHARGVPDVPDPPSNQATDQDLSRDALTKQTMAESGGCLHTIKLRSLAESIRKMIDGAVSIVTPTLQPPTPAMHGWAPCTQRLSCWLAPMTIFMLVPCSSKQARLARCWSL